MKTDIELATVRKHLIVFFLLPDPIPTTFGSFQVRTHSTVFLHIVEDSISTISGSFHYLISETQRLLLVHVVVRFRIGTQEDTFEFLFLIVETPPQPQLWVGVFCIL
jgi:hypothetical protein